MHVYVYMCMCACMCVHVCVHVCVCMCVCACMHVCVHVCAYYCMMMFQRQNHMYLLELDKREVLFSLFLFPQVVFIKTLLTHLLHHTITHT